MTNEEVVKAIDNMIDYLLAYKYQRQENDVEALRIARDLVKSQPKWIPVSDPLNELPKDKYLYVTTKYGDVETLHYDMTEWDDADIARCTVAYMDYYEPQPYAESEGERVTIDEAIKKMWEHELDIGDFDKWGDKK